MIKIQKLLVYYSRTNTTKKVFEYLTKKCKCDIEVIKDVKTRDGLVGYIRSGKEAMRKTHPKILPITHDPSKYDIIVVGTPNWAGTMSSPMRSYLKENGKKMKKVAFVCVQGGRGHERVFSHIQELTKKPIAEVMLLTKEVITNNYKIKMDSFIQKLG